jgi:hypothetical protein
MARHVLIGVLAAAAATLAVMPTDAVAGGKRQAPPVAAEAGVDHPASGYYRRRAPQVRGFLTRRGGYSYSSSDVFNTYGDARTRFGSTSSYRDPMLDRQTNSGPFDHGFFFDSGIGPRGGNAPYPN